MLLPIIFFLNSVCGEIFKFSKESPSLDLFFKLNVDNINTGHFELLEADNMKFESTILSTDKKKILFSNVEGFKLNEKTRFSFSNTEVLEVILTIKGTIIDSTLPSGGMVELKFESLIDTFKQDVSKKFQYEPAIYSLELLLTKLKEVTDKTKAGHSLGRNLGLEQRNMMYFILFMSTCSFLVYIALNIYQFYMMKKYLNQKKYL